MSPEMPGRAPSPTAQPEPENAVAAEHCACEDTGPGAFRFDDPYWDDAFDSYHSSTLRTCCLVYR
jgi:hypothetical protein